MQAIIDITQQEYRRQQEAAPGGGAQDLPLGTSSFNPGLSHVTQTPPSGGFVASGGFPSTRAVDFPGLDPASDSTAFNFMHKSEVVQGEQDVAQVSTKLCKRQYQWCCGKQWMRSTSTICLHHPPLPLPQPHPTETLLCTQLRRWPVVDRPLLTRQRKT